jgi:hypothetical protein
MAFSTCVAPVPEAAAVFYKRALALAALGKPDQALRDYDSLPPPASRNPKKRTRPRRFCPPSFAE